MTTYNTNPVTSSKGTKKNIKANSYINGINDKSKTPNNMILQHNDSGKAGLMAFENNKMY